MMQQDLALLRIWSNTFSPDYAGCGLKSRCQICGSNNKINRRPYADGQVGKSRADPRPAIYETPSVVNSRAASLDLERIHLNRPFAHGFKDF